MSFGANSNNPNHWDTRTVSNMGSFSKFSSASKRPQFSIQSIPHCLQHSKTPFKDYFENIQNDQIQQEEVSRVTVNKSGIKKNKMPENPYVQSRMPRQKGKQQMIQKLQKVAQKRVKDAFKMLKNTNIIEKTAQKVATFRNQTEEGEQKKQNIDIHLKLIGKIAKQNISAQSMLKTASKSRFTQKESIVVYQKHITIVNKLILIEGQQLLQSYSNLSNQKSTMHKSSMSRIALSFS